ncbi:hypothetical protein G3M48_007684 [Beauveria asiatica]|uniref:Uncharacterized protein n=1 Tax=Beauveria asiatica TaxID=1069075 RepID=A0AAW0S4U0_9HYPO
MASPLMLSIENGIGTKKMTANLLPCRIHHNGSIDPVGAYWRPTDNKDNSKEAYFRGRRLKGKTLPLPQGYRGVVLERKADELKKEAPQPCDGEAADDDDVVAMETVGKMQATGQFDEMVIWSHESMASAAADPYVRSIEEWLQVSEKARAMTRFHLHIWRWTTNVIQIHGFDAENSDKTR